LFFCQDHGSCYRMAPDGCGDLVAYTFLKDGAVRAACVREDGRVIVYGILGRFTNYDFTVEVLWNEQQGALTPSALNYVAFLMSGVKCAVGVAWSLGVLVRSCMVGLMVSTDDGSTFEAPAGVDTGAVCVYSSELVCATSRNHVTVMHMATRKAVTTRVDTESIEPAQRLYLRGICVLPKGSWGGEAVQRQ